MDKLILKIKNTFFTKQFFIFVTIGVINTFIGIIFAYIFSKFLNENIAFIVGYICGLFVSYLLNSFFTFKETLDLSKFIKFAISYIPNFIIQNIVVLIVFNIMGLYKLIAYILAAIIGVPLTFILMKFFAFKHREKKIFKLNKVTTFRIYFKCSNFYLNY
ncbi:GtrA family protein [Clostridium taeniosporum]|uniref:Polysaccharide synthesis protein GtrA n=1 Tax=Clostridium taeniosporum TaxID=394958 RepID=A0A1D7XKZ5_9CLOT|nr:GtrA family protein [Clostridium taeniosporum]AOR24006.2 polysaccharide synthesis protein GtrA [Clostridium taeniosporum]